MAEATSEHKLIQEYEAIRQTEYELITNLLDVLPRIDTMSEDRVGQVRDALFHADHPYLMVLTGPFSSGKSSIINALLGADNLLKIGPTPTTDRINILRWGDDPQHTGTAGSTDTVFYPAEMLKRVSLVDTPGLESIFKDHEETTRRFLHRADTVLLIMQAMQAMTQKNIEYLQMFKEYGKKVIIVISQSDLVTDEEQATIEQYVKDQCREHLGLEPTVWFVSARVGLEAQKGEVRDEELWEKSGLAQITDYIDDQLSDAERLRQKLTTPLQIVQSVHQNALVAVRQNQSTFDRYRSITDNIEQQLAAQRREQSKTVRDINNEVELRFRQTGDRSKEAILDIFQFSRAINSLGRGLSELVGLARLFRRNDTNTYMEETFRRFKVFEPIDEIPAITDKLASRLEGQDMQDIDDLVKYGNKEIHNLPNDVSDKVIGTIQAPVKYDRTFLTNVRDDLEAIEEEARVIETNKLEQIRRNTLLYLAWWEVIVIVCIVALFFAWDTVNGVTQFPASVLVLFILLGLALVGFASIPLRGRILHTQYVNRLLKLQARYTDVLTKSADKQIEYGQQLRHETITPLTRLVEAQASIQDEQLNKLQSAEQTIAKIELQLNKFGKRKIMGLVV